MPNDEIVLETARAIRPYLTELVEAEASALDQRLAELLAAAGRGEEVGGRILEALAARPVTHEWAAVYLVEQRPPELALGHRGLPNPLGDGIFVSAVKYACPDGDYVWWERAAGQSPPPCPTHRHALRVVQDAV